MPSTRPRSLAILHVAGEFPPRRLGGIATYLDNIVRCASPGIEIGVLVVEGRDYHDDPTDARPKVELDSLDLSRAIARLADTKLLDIAELASRIGRAPLLERPWDIVHSHDWYGVLPALLSRARFGAKLLMTAHLPLRLGFTYANHPIPIQEKTRLEALGFRLADRVIAPSRYVARLLEREYDVVPQKIRVIPNGVALDEFRPKLHAAGPDLLSVSRLSDQKGLDHLLEIFAHVRSALPAAKLSIAGDGPSRPAIEARIEELAITEAVEVVGYVPHHRLAELYASASVFVSTSIYEPFGLTTLEAMAAGCPVVASPLGGAPDFVRDGDDGFLIPPQRTEDFAQAVISILSDPALARKLGHNARQRAEQFSWQRSATELEAEYARLSGPSGAIERAS